MKNKIIALALAFMLGGASFAAEKLTEVVYMQCMNLETSEVRGSIKVRKSGLVVTIMDAEKVLSWEEIDLLKKVGQELSE
jgi:hypothetical protein